MKKSVLTIMVLFLAITTTNASSKNIKRTEITTRYADVSPFCKLIQSGNYEAVKAMIESGVDINKKSTGLTPLMFAARYNKAKIAKLLIERGAKLKVKSDNGFTALKYAQLSKATDALAVIEEALNS
ncbi:ankyrin repeat domain-containing protein [Tenacibaculum adriaticum]|nr:ankyrin repeat domain-containing protein [Tenacibaculum adriaticum]